MKRSVIICAMGVSTAVWAGSSTSYPTCNGQLSGKEMRFEMRQTSDGADGVLTGQVVVGSDSNYLIGKFRCTSGAGSILWACVDGAASGYLIEVMSNGAGGASSASISLQQGSPAERPLGSMTCE